MPIRTWLSIAALCTLAAGCGSDEVTDDATASPSAPTAAGSDRATVTSPDADDAADEASGDLGGLYGDPSGSGGGDTGDTTADADADSDDDPDDDAGGVTVMLAEHPELGEYLVDGAGRTLYLFDQDDGTTTACTGACADTWPPLAADGELVAGDGIDGAALSTADGIVPDQVTFHGQLMYLFVGDIVPGDINGVGLPSWYAVDASGAAID